MKRIFHPYDKWEETASGMWRIVGAAERDEFKLKAAALMRDTQAFEDAMMLAVERWPVSCEVNLSAGSMNRQAWIGHAGCCIALDSPEDATRLGWHMLTKNEQDLANAAADRAIAEWERRHAQDKSRG